MKIQDLETLGLNKNESKVYYALLKIGDSSAADLVKELGVHRNIVYDNLDKLIEKGLVSYIIQDTKKLFIPQDPSSILDFLDKKQKEIEKKKLIANKLILEIKDLRKNNKNKQEAEIFRGINGMKKVLSKILNSKENFVLGMTNKSTELLGETFWKNYNTKIKYFKIKEKLLLNSNFFDIYSFKNNRQIQVRILPKEFDQITEIVLFNGHVAIFVYSEKPIVFLIKDKYLYDSYLVQFNFLWKKSKSLSK